MSIWVIVYRSACAVLVVVGIVVLFYIFMPKWRTYNELRETAQKHKAENAALEANKEDLVSKQQQFQTDPSFVEHTAREIGMVKTNEVKIVFTTNEAPTRSAPPALPPKHAGTRPPRQP